MLANLEMLKMYRGCVCVGVPPLDYKSKRTVRFVKSVVTSLLLVITSFLVDVFPRIDTLNC